MAWLLPIDTSCGVDFPSLLFGIVVVVSWLLALTLWPEIWREVRASVSVLGYGRGSRVDLAVKVATVDLAVVAATTDDGEAGA
jgi:hypothetical protein